MDNQCQAMFRQGAGGSIQCQRDWDHEEHHANIPTKWYNDDPDHFWGDDRFVQCKAVTLGERCYFHMGHSKRHEGPKYTWESDESDASVMDCDRSYRSSCSPFSIWCNKDYGHEGAHFDSEADIRWEDEPTEETVPAHELNHEEQERLCWESREIDRKILEGERQIFEGGGQRDTQDGKPRFDLLVPKGVPFEEQFVTRIARLLANGAERYGDRNWEEFKTQDAADRAKSSAFRHFMQWLTGETGEDHAAAVVFNLMAAEHADRGRR